MEVQSVCSGPDLDCKVSPQQCLRSHPKFSPTEAIIDISREVGRLTLSPFTCS